MEQLVELSSNDLKEVVGGASFAYRAGQAVSIIWDLSFGGMPNVLDTYGGTMAAYDWFF